MARVAGAGVHGPTSPGTRTQGSPPGLSRVGLTPLVSLVAPGHSWGSVRPAGESYTPQAF